MATYTDEEKEYASKGVGNAGLTLGIIGTSLASGLLGNGNGGLFGGNSSAVTAHAEAVNADLKAQIAKLEAEKYTDQSSLDVRDRIAALNEKVIGYTIDIDKRVAALETSVPLREQIVLGKVQEVAASLSCCQNNVQLQLNSISATLAGITKTVVPNTSVCPGWGNVTITPATTTTTSES